MYSAYVQNSHHQREEGEVGCSALLCSAQLSQSAYTERPNPLIEEETPLPSSDRGNTDGKEIALAYFRKVG
jgi:hypothetical protein